MTNAELAVKKIGKAYPKWTIKVREYQDTIYIHGGVLEDVGGISVFLGNSAFGIREEDDKIVVVFLWCRKTPEDWDWYFDTWDEAVDFVIEKSKEISP